MNDSNKSEVIRDVEIRILKSKEFTEGGMAYINRIQRSNRLAYDICSEIERADDRDGSKALESYLNDTLRLIGQKIWLFHILATPAEHSRMIANSAFRIDTCRTEQGILNGDPTEKTAEHPSFGTVLVKCLTFVEFVGPDDLRPV